MKAGGQIPNMGDTARYHHGNLAEALLDAAELELMEKGLEAFSLRGVAKRAGVSHAAPAHHFKDVTGLLTALAIRGFRRFTDTQVQEEAAAGSDPRQRMVANGLGYVKFATSNPALFRLMFSSGRPDFENPDLAAVADASFNRLTSAIRAIEGNGDLPDIQVQRDAAAAWSMVHGMADLMVSGKLDSLTGLPEPERDAAIRSIILRITPAGR